MADSTILHSETFNELSQKNGDSVLQLCIVESNDDKELKEAIKCLDYSLLVSTNGFEYLNDYTIGFVLKEFTGDVYEKLFRNKNRLFGSIAVKQCAKRQQPLPNLYRPLYCLCMRQLIFCFTGFKKKEEITRLVNLVHHMGGSIRKDLNSKVTHLIANTTGGDKFRAAVSLGISIMNKEWILHCWENRHDLDCFACDEELLTKFKVQPFFCCNLVFFGFSAEDQKEMELVTINNGGHVVSLENPNCTHIIIEDQCKDVPSSLFERGYVVKAEWFWASIQMDACADEGLYQFKQEQCTPKMTKPSPASESRSAKRRRLRHSLAQLASSGEISQSKCKSNDTSLSSSFLDATPDILDDGQENQAPSVSFSNKYSIRVTPRQQVCMELFQTESNYVEILHTIMKVFREPLEKGDQVGGPILDPTEIKIIFGNLAPIYELHQKIQYDLGELMNNWNEEARIANVILHHADAILKSYPPFINFFEKTKEILLKCDQHKPRFHAFLKICQSRSECGRQSLTELLIRPVQRLPSIILLLKDILKHTSKTNPDYPALEQAIIHLKKVMTDINEDRRKAEGHLAMFDVINDIDNCPPNLLSSHRSFITKADLIELSDGVSGKGDPVTMFLFSDTLEIGKRRLKALKSPGAGKTPQKCYKHILLIPLSHIKRVVDIKETADCKSVFALICRSNSELKERLYTFRILDFAKLDFLKILCRHIANTVCRADSGNFLATLDPQELDIGTSDVMTNTFSKALRFASKTGRKVSRAFSFTKTPRKLKRAISSISPYTAFDEDDCSHLSAGYSEEQLSPIGSLPPCTPVTHRKIKSSSLGPSGSYL